MVQSMALANRPEYIPLMLSHGAQRDLMIDVCTHMLAIF